MKLKFKLPLSFLGIILVTMVAFFIFVRFQTSKTVLDALVEYRKNLAGAGNNFVLAELINANLLGKFLVFFLAVGLVSFAAMTLFFHNNITKPINKLNDRLKTVSKFQHREPLGFKSKDEIGELYAHVAEMEGRLHEAHLYEVNVIGAIAHDLKTPLTSINGFLELIETQPDLNDQKKAEYMRLVRKKAEDMTELVQEFSNYTALEIQMYEIKLNEINAAELLNKVGNEYEAELAGMDIEFEWNNQLGNEILLANELLLRRLFANIFSNAVRYGIKESVKVGEEKRIIRMHGYAEDSKVCITIEDNGNGVPDSELEKIFQKFYTLSPARQRKHGGTGLGLASCESIMTRLGGSISAYRDNLGGLGIRLQF